MTLRNPKLFGLDVNSNYADVENKNQALIALNLPPLDLDVIRGSSLAATRNDFVSFSRLSQPIYKILDRYSSDSATYLDILSGKAGTDSILFGNLNINGGLSGNAIRFRYVDGTGPSASIKIADISTSRVSAWSSSAIEPDATSPISYGARVGIITGGSLQFGTPATSGQVRLQTTIVPQAKEFDSEFPTHKINCTIGGQTVSLYAMKGIPLVFTGFFRNLDATITLRNLIGGTPASWKIVNTANANDFVRFANQGGNSSTINFRSSISRERYIQFYYNPDEISSITINSANISDLPVTKLENATTLNLSYNTLRNFPDLTFFSPNVQSISFTQNPFYLSDTVAERKLNSNIIDKIPKTVKNFVMGGTFYGSITQNSIADRFQIGESRIGLTELNLYRGGGAYFHPDDSDNTCVLPNVPDSCQTYLVDNNDFRAIGIATAGDNALGRYNIKQLTNLTTLSLNGNYYLEYNGEDLISSSNNKINAVNIYGCAVRCPNLSGKQSLTTFYGHYNRNIGSIFTSGGTYKFDGCGALDTLYFYASPLTGAMPKFTNTSLRELELRATNLTGGAPDPTGAVDPRTSGVGGFVIPERTFEQSPNLERMLLQSGNLLPDPIHPNAFTYTPKLSYLHYISYGITTGALPSLASCSNLTWIVLHYNNFTGNFPNLAANPSIYYVDCSYNSLSGNIPGFKNLSSLSYLFLYNNQFTGITKFTNLPNLAYFYAHNNQLSGEIPDFTDCPNMYYLILFNNQLTSYKSGSFSSLSRLNYLDLSNNLLSQQAINSIISDLYTNYNSSNRGGVTINLRGNASPSGDAINDYIDILRSKGWSIALD
jgi:Leucine-rich repeat (LRR) protein